jgi:hypothetical protein
VSCRQREAAHGHEEEGLRAYAPSGLLPRRDPTKGVNLSKSV